MKPRRAAALWGPLLALMALEFFLSSLSRVPLADRFDDKLLHLSGYAVMGALALRASHGGFPRPLRRAPVLFAGALTVGYGILDEFHQSFVPGRTADAQDVAADLAGFVVAAIAFAIVARWPRRSTL